MPSGTTQVNCGCTIKLHNRAKLEFEQTFMDFAGALLSADINGLVKKLFVKFRGQISEQDFWIYKKIKTLNHYLVTI